MRVAVVGGGLAGLTAAYRLATSGARVTLLESSQRTGGWASTSRHRVAFERDGVKYAGEITLEAGPRSIRPRGGPGAPAMLKLIRDIGLEDSIVPIPLSHPAAKNRYLLDPESGKLSLVKANLLALLDPRTPRAIRQLMLAFAAEPFRRRNQPAGDESVHSFFERRFGAGVAQTASAFVHGIYAADPATLSLRSGFGLLHSAEARHGSVVKGMILGARSEEDVAAEAAAWAELGELGKKRAEWSMFGLKGGLESLTRVLGQRAREAGVDMRLGPEVERIAASDAGVEITANGDVMTADHVVAAIPSPVLDAALASPLPNLTANPATTVGVINVVYPLPPSQVHPNGFGYLIPRGAPSDSPEGALGVVFDSTAIPGVGDDLEGEVTKLTVMMGGPYWSSYSSPSGSPLPVPSTAEELVEPALKHLERVFPHLRGVEPLLVVPHLNRNCIPTYAPGHGARLRELHESIAAGPWKGKLSVAGAGYGGVSVNDVVLGGDLVARGLIAGEQTTGLERWANWV